MRRLWTLWRNRRRAVREQAQYTTVRGYGNAPVLPIRHRKGKIR